MTGSTRTTQQRGLEAAIGAPTHELVVNQVQPIVGRCDFDGDRMILNDISEPSSFQIDSLPQHQLAYHSNGTKDDQGQLQEIRHKGEIDCTRAFFLSVGLRRIGDDPASFAKAAH
ncbi:hypothetical protein CROQUDRAFT_356979 [Cronartium quercuum f. sp. fusiforme G11]|uniref:Uncharacterized protein n=1 Tax=Cronartium quercuum f. sp. fusiforme G11 TaxID=708437 RepID=A0A9P6T5Z9_9BASI|nr:hypothetical protein CROQUDRAFT_356979 [Cronartium quercuum f. sp. fusiforme G11]